MKHNSPAKAHSELDPDRLIHLFDHIEPLPCDRWLASSALQKAIRRGDVLTAQRAARTLYRADPRAVWRRLLIIAFEDVGIGAIEGVTSTAARVADAQMRREAGGDEAAFLATCRQLAEAPKDRSADLLFAAALHDPALEAVRAECRALSLPRRLDLVADRSRPLPERATAAWFASGVESRGERRVGVGDFPGLMRTYAGLGAPPRLLEAVATGARKTREPITVFLPLLWLAAAEGEANILDDPLVPTGSVHGVPLYALDKHTRLGRQAIQRFGRQNAEIARFVKDYAPYSPNDGALRMAVFYADSALTRPSLRCKQSTELESLGAAADFYSVNAAAVVGVALIRLVRENLAQLNAIRAELLTRDLAHDR